MTYAGKSESRYAYSSSYEEARRRFCETVSRLGATVEQHPVQTGRDGNLTIDVAVIGSTEPTWSMVVSSGLHGIEGFVGSAVQIAFLRDMRLEEVAGKRGQVVVMHALNPYGFHHLRRANEDNVDLNRNFLLPGEPYQGVSEGYARLNRILNPMGASTAVDLFYITALWHAWRSGLPKVKEAVAGGQYEFPRGLFFGGDKPAPCHQILRQNLMRWIKGRHVVHCDLHSGLGAYADYRLVVAGDVGSRNAKRYSRLFGAHVEVVTEDQQAIGGEHDGRDGAGYRTKGNIGRWIRALANNLDYHCLTLEFGTYSPIRMLRALRNENRAHFYTPEGDVTRERAKAELLECFCPESPSWRQSALEHGTAVLDRAQGAAWRLASGER
jgi:hypothetical protein